MKRNAILDLLRLVIISCCALLALSSVAAGLAQKPQPIALRLDPTTTAINWTLNTNVHIVHGTFKLKSASFSIDPVTGNASGLIVIDATSGESGEPARDKRMHAAILESAKYPTITFRPTHVDGKVDLGAPGPVTLHGVMNLHGQDHPLDLTVNLAPQPAAAALTTHFAVPFVAWGLKDPSTFIFRTDKQVSLDVSAIAMPAQ
jgi:polyisoprenoid-binding protein YceI